ncbi:glycosyltransferase [Mucilaginibacter sp. L3T2-6]|uniref:glycosyltransferase n=1 Tax=Mucilaginibacter sp. L3T2-6 TaxID=3062491 RepID=UPI00267536FD|nr:glycosyltransferase [Mucilaginibacter sp. L3T2-6]MDO3643397.1 glycosyltransferase [Mucilaginibacter sp. L3T2-6]MDV6215670.1 glycosyltransferase [Mucilaginibacter sp. L3T2-6]
MPPDNPKVTVLMPAYNAGKYIGEAISSVLSQTFTDFELLIINDGSTDNTLEVINSFHDRRIVVISQENKGVSAALNLGLEHARATYIARFDADDICLPDRLKVQYQFITNYPDYSIIGSAAEYMDADGHYIFTHHPEGHLNEEIQQLQYTICPFIHSSVFYKKDAVVKSGGYNEHAYTYEDHFLWVNLLRNEKACNLSQALIKVRLNPESVTIDEKWRTRKFRAIKYSTLKNRNITAAEGDKLYQIGGKQYSSKIKYGAYYALCGKKFLLNNYQPEKARTNMLRAILLHPLRLDNYLLYTVSYFPERFINWLHNLTQGKF